MRERRSTCSHDQQRSQPFRDNLESGFKQIWSTSETSRTPTTRCWGLSAWQQTCSRLGGFFRGRLTTSWMCCGRSGWDLSATPCRSRWDPDGAFQKEFTEQLESAGVHVNTIPAEAHWRIAPLRGGTRFCAQWWRSWWTRGHQRQSSGLGDHGGFTDAQLLGLNEGVVISAAFGKLSLIVHNGHLLAEELRSQALRAVAGHPAWRYGGLLALDQEGGREEAWRLRLGRLVHHDSDGKSAWVHSHGGLAFGPTSADPDLVRMRWGLRSLRNLSWHRLQLNHLMHRKHFRYLKHHQHWHQQLNHHHNYHKLQCSKLKRRRTSFNNNRCFHRRSTSATQRGITTCHRERIIRHQATVKITTISAFAATLPGRQAS